MGARRRHAARLPHRRRASRGRLGGIRALTIDRATALFARFRQDRDEEIFRALFRETQPRLLRLATRLAGGRRDEAEDVLQEAWIRAVERVDRFRGDSSVLTWVSGIVVRCAWERRRRHAGWEIETARDAEVEPPPDELVRTDLGRAMSRLPPGCREVLVLHDLEGYTHQEIAGLLGFEPGTSKSQLHRARRLLRGWLVPQEVP